MEIRFIRKQDYDAYMRAMAYSYSIEVDTKGRVKCEECRQYHWDNEPHGATTYGSRPK